MFVATLPRPAGRPLFASQPSPAPPAEEPPLDRAELAGMAVGGLVGGAGLGYLGVDLGVRWGLSYGMGLLGSAPLAQVSSLLLFGLPYAALGGALLGAVGVTAGVGLGVWLGGKAGRALGGK